MVERFCASHRVVSGSNPFAPIKKQRGVAQLVEYSCASHGEVGGSNPSSPMKLQRGIALIGT